MTADEVAVTTVIDLDDLATWPDSVLAWASDWAKRPLSLDPVPGVLMEHDDELRQLLAGHKVLAYHCTRQLDYEIGGVRSQGLRRLSPELVADRLRGACERGFLTPDQHASLSMTTVFALGEQENREGQICLILGRSTLDREAHGCAPLLETWGGEGIYWGAPERDPLLQSLGRPAIVVAGIDLDDREKAWAFCLGASFVAKLRGEEEMAGAEIFYRADIPAEDIFDIWQPGSPEYDQHVDLPR